MKLYEYYQIVVNENGENVLELTEDPMPQDGYSREPLCYEDPDGDELEGMGYPFDGISTSFSGDHHTYKIVEGTDTVTIDDFEGEVSTAGVYYYRTGIYTEDEEYTGYDSVVCLIPDED